MKDLKSETEVLTDEVRNTLGILLTKEKEKGREGAVQYIFVFHVDQASWNICKQTIAHL